MKVVISVLIILALAAVTLVQGDDACGTKAKNCYTQSKTKIDKGFTSLDLISACQAYATQYNCLQDLNSDATCNDGNNPMLEKYKGQSKDDVDGVCGTDGTVGKCGSDLSDCMKLTIQIKQDFDNKDAKKACPALQQFDSCVRLTVGSNECPDKYTKILKSTREAFAEDDLLGGCEGTCGQKAGECSKSLSGFFNKPLSEMDFPTFCQDAYKAVSCIEKLSSDTACSGQTKNLDQASKMAEGLKKYVGDFCDASGKPTACSTRVQDCSNKLKNLDQNSGTTAMCQATADFLECAANVPCRASLKTFIDNNRQVLESQERQHNCPTVGSCTDRLKTCGDKENEFDQVQKGEGTDAICALTRAGLACFDAVKKDVTCKTEAAMVSTFEKRMNKVLSGKCGASAIQMSLLVIVVSLFASLRKLV